MSTWDYKITHNSFNSTKQQTKTYNHGNRNKYERIKPNNGGYNQNGQ